MKKAAFDVKFKETGAVTVAAPFYFWKDVGEMFSFLQMIEVTHSFLVQNKPENGLKTRRIIYGEKKFKPV